MRKLLIDQNINNLDLIISIKTMQADPNPQKQSEFINRMIHSSFLCPAVLDPEPELNEKGEMELEQGIRIMFNTVSSPDKKSYVVVFTDKKEADTHKKDEHQHTVVTTYLDLCNILLKTETPYAGFVINPFSENVIFTKEIMRDINQKIRVVQLPKPGMVPNDMNSDIPIQIKQEKGDEKV